MSINGGPLGPSTPEEVVAALLALDGRGEHPTYVFRERDGSIVSLFAPDLAAIRADFSQVFSQPRLLYTVRLHPETNEWTAHQTEASGSRAQGFRVSSRWVTEPVQRVLAEHGWTRRRSALGKAFSRLLGR
jgi:hypothetical protein